MATKAEDRSKNKCLDCGYEWFPGTMDKAMMCPRCDGTDISYGLVDRVPAYLITAALGGLVIATVWTVVKILVAYIG